MINKKILRLVPVLLGLTVLLQITVVAAAAQLSSAGLTLLNEVNEIDSFEHLMNVDETPLYGVGRKPLNDSSAALSSSATQISLNMAASDMTVGETTISFELYPTDQISNVFFYGRSSLAFYWNRITIPVDDMKVNDWNKIVVLIRPGTGMDLYLNDKYYRSIGDNASYNTPVSYFYFRIEATKISDAVGTPLYVDEVQVADGIAIMPSMVAEDYSVDGNIINDYVGATVGDVLNAISYNGTEVVIKDTMGNDVTNNTDEMIFQDYQLYIYDGPIITGHFYFGDIPIPDDYTEPSVTVTQITDRVVEDKPTEFEATVNVYDTVNRVDFYVDGDLVYTDGEAPYILSHVFTQGEHTVSAAVTDNYKETAYSEEMTVMSNMSSKPRIKTSLANGAEYDREELSAVTAEVVFGEGELIEGSVLCDGEKIANIGVGKNTVDLSKLSLGTHNITFRAVNSYNEEGELTVSITVLRKFSSLISSNNYETSGSAEGATNSNGFIGYEQVRGDFGNSLVVGADGANDTSIDGAWIAIPLGSCKTRLTANFDFYLNAMRGRVQFFYVGTVRCTFFEIENGSVVASDGQTYSFDADHWYKAQIDMDMTRNVFTLYLDGEPALIDVPTGLPEGEAASTIRIISFLEGIPKTYYAIDNYELYHFSSSPIITEISSPNGYGSNRVSSADSTLNVKFSELLTQESVYASKFSITSEAGSVKIIDAKYNLSDSSVTLTLDGTLEPGKYRLTCAENLVMGNGELYGEKIYMDFEALKTPLIVNSAAISDDGMFTAEIENITDSECEAYMIVNVFENGRLVEHYAKQLAINADSNTVQETIRGFSEETDVEVFIWDNLKAPYCIMSVSNE